jgi:spore photoproduct lyase
VNVEEILDGVFERIDRSPDQIFRIGTGEFTDSLALDPFVSWSDVFIPAFSTRRNVVLEFKTKTENIRGLLSSKHRDRIIVSWSLNSPYIAAREELRAPSLRKRIEAAKQCQSEGFALGFHFDPIIAHPDWKTEYLKTLDLMDKHIDPRGVIWMSLGSFRFMPKLKPIIRKRHPGSCVLNGEFIKGLDGKMRYFKPIRMELYGFMRECLENWWSDLGLYLCMEGDDVWRKIMNWSPSDSEGLSAYLDRRVTQFFG